MFTKTLTYKAILFPFGPIFSMIFITVIILGQGYALWHHFSLSGFFDAYGSLILFLILILYSFFLRKQY